MERILPYDRTIVPQETGYWCGPASVQVVLNSLGIRVAEQDMAHELGTTVNGTNLIGSFPQVLNQYANAGYFMVEMPHDPPRTEQKERLWRDLVASINGGRGVIVNIVAPPSNYPRGVKGSQSPRYGGGVVYHYMSVMGYDDAGARAVWIADSGFQPQGYWMAFDQLATLIPPKGYTAAPGPAVLEQSTPPPAAAPGLTAETLAEAMGNPDVPLDRYRALLPRFSAAMVAAGCTTVERAAMWCAQLGHESRGLGLFRELWGPTADQLTYDGRMGNGPGEGFKYRGRGAIQVTGRNNYTALSAWAFDHGHTPTRTFFVDQPDALEFDDYAFLGAVWYWTTQRPLNDLADARDIAGATRAINGGTNGLADRQLRYQRCLNLGAALLPATDSEELTVADIERLERFVEDFLVGYLGPALSDIKDIREQLTGGRDLVRREDGSVDLPASFPGWPQLGGDTVVDALGIVLQNQVNTAQRLDALEDGRNR